MKKRHSWITAALIAGILYFVLFRKSFVADAATMEMVNRIENDYGQDADDASRVYKAVPFRRILGIVATESGGAFEATGEVGERGLMQMTPAAMSDVNRRYGTTFQWHDMYDPRLNIFAGTAYLALLTERLGNLDRATRAYNVGEANVLNSTTNGAEYLERVKFYEGLY